MKAIDPDYEVYVGVPRLRQAFWGGVWVTVLAWDIGRAPAVAWRPEVPEDRRIMRVQYGARKPRERKGVALATRNYLRVTPGGASAAEIAWAIADGSKELREAKKLRERVQQVLMIYPDWFERVSPGRWVCK